MENTQKAGGCLPWMVAVIVAVGILFVLSGAFDGLGASRRLEAQAQIAIANAQAEQARTQRWITTPLVVASLKDSALVVWYALRDAGRELVLSIAVALLAWRAWASKGQAPPQSRRADELDPPGEA